jgi:signal transduction histidine kinase
VLADRGLEAALASLADQSALPVTVDAQVGARLPGAVETAAYFVVAEALANAAKHSGASRITVAVTRRGDTLEVRVEDDGCGAADPDGSGLTGMRRRVEALDGTLAVTSPEGGPTVVRAELPCAS